MRANIILGVETSCDETAAAVYHSDRGVLSNVIYSQTELHAQYGGVVPEIASRSHIEKIAPIIQAALDQACVTLSDITALAVTSKPGLPGSLLVGVCFAKSIAYVKKIPLIGVNHLEGHAFSASIEREVPFPHLCITASGGHTSLYLMHDYGKYTILGQTTDDAAGEAFDKVAKLMNLPYPGGPIIETLAKAADFEDFFQFPRLKNSSCNFSFSGLKTAVLYHLVNKNAYDMSRKKFTADEDLLLKQQTASSMLVCVGDIFEQRLKKALSLYPQVKAVTFVGGVACNAYLRKRIATWAEKNHLAYFNPRPEFCTDNAAMIAFVANYKVQQEEYSDLALDIM